ncbi:MAG: hypothetical protein KIT43_14730 [Bauldia sp.]|nr:hypothetical protein [Bauldia sp.]
MQHQPDQSRDRAQHAGEESRTPRPPIEPHSPDSGLAKVPGEIRNEADEPELVSQAGSELPENNDLKASLVGPAGLEPATRPL